MVYVKLYLQGTECPALIDSGVSDNFISEGLVRQLNLRVRDLTQPCDVRAANGELMPCRHCVIVRARLGELPFTLPSELSPQTYELSWDTLSSGSSTQKFAGETE